MGIIARFFGKRETTEQRLVGEYNRNPWGFPGLTGNNIQEYVANVAPRLKDSEKDKPLRDLLAVYPPAKWTSRG